MKKIFSNLVILSLILITAACSNSENVDPYASTATTPIDTSSNVFLPSTASTTATAAAVVTCTNTTVAAGTTSTLPACGTATTFTSLFDGATNLNYYSQICFSQLAQNPAFAGSQTITTNAQGQQLYAAAVAALSQCMQNVTYQIAQQQQQYRMQQQMYQQQLNFAWAFGQICKAVGCLLNLFSGVPDMKIQYKYLFLIPAMLVIGCSKAVPSAATAFNQKMAVIIGKNAQTFEGLAAKARGVTYSADINSYINPTTYTQGYQGATNTNYLYNSYATSNIAGNPLTTCQVVNNQNMQAQLTDINAVRVALLNMASCIAAMNYANPINYAATGSWLNQGSAIGMMYPTVATNMSASNGLPMQAFNNFYQGMSGMAVNGSFFTGNGNAAQLYGLVDGLYRLRAKPIR